MDIVKREGDISENDDIRAQQTFVDRWKIASQRLEVGIACVEKNYNQNCLAVHIFFLRVGKEQHS